MAEQRKSKKSETVDWLREALTLAKYFDYYGPLFDEHQRAVFEDYICNDMSLSEISGREGMTRQGVSDLVHRTSSKLHAYEESLHLAERAEYAGTIIDTMRERIEKGMFSEADREELNLLLNRLSETL